MRHVKLVGGLAAAICVLAVAAAPAGAHQFTANKLGKSVGRGFEEIPVEKGVTPPFEPARMQEWKLGTFRILCYKARLNGEVTEQVAEVFTTTIHFINCGWYPQRNTLHVAAIFSKEGLTVRFHANGYTEAVGEGSGEVYEFKKAEVLETAAYVKINATKLCKIVIPEQTIPVKAIKHPEDPYSSAIYSDLEVEATNKHFFPSGKQKRIAIANDFKNLKFKYAGEGTQCATAPEFEKQAEEGGGGVAGAYKGSVEAWIPNGDLSFE